jgi:hypothetical protein
VTPGPEASMRAEGGARSDQGGTKRTLAALVLLAAGSAWAGPEILKGVRYRAVTLAHEERKLFKIPDVERLTASSGLCLEETLDVEETQTLIISATCAGVRTSMVWLKDGTRIHMLACAEGAQLKPELKKLRAKLQAELKSWKSATACVRGGRVELWGWVEEPNDKERIEKIAAKYDVEKVVNKVELVEP